VCPCNFQRIVQLSVAQLREHGCRPALPAPSVRDRRERVRGEHALELLLLGRELEIRRASVSGERHISAFGFERRAVEMRMFARSLERKRSAPQVRSTSYAIQLPFSAFSPARPAVYIRPTIAKEK